MEITFRFPFIFFILLIPVIVYSVRYYLKERTFDRRSHLFIFVLKSFFLMMLVLILFDPVIIERSKELKQVKHIMLFDNSRSISHSDAEDLQLIKDTYSSVINDSTFITCTFGDSLKIMNSKEQPDFSENFSSISSGRFKNSINELISENDPGTITLITDGNFTDVNNFSLKAEGVPVNILRTSQEKQIPDIYIKEIVYDDIIYDNKTVKYTVIVGMRGTTSEKEFELKIKNGPKTINSVSETIPENKTFVSIDIEIDDQNSSVLDLEFSINGLKNEENLSNNTKTTYQRKLKSENTILILAESPSLDLHFLTEFLKSNGYFYNILYSGSNISKAETDKFKSLIVLTPTDKLNSFSYIIKKFNSVLVFTGREISKKFMNMNFGTGLKTSFYKKNKGLIKDNNSDRGSYLLRYGKEMINSMDIGELTYNSSFSPDPEAYFQSLSYSNTLSSHAVYHSKSNTKNIILLNFSDFWYNLFNDDRSKFSKFLINIIEQLSTDRSEERMKITSEKKIYYSGENIIFKGKILDSNMRPVSNLDVSLLIKENSASSIFAYSGNEYRSSIMIKEPGIYTAVVTSEDKNEKDLKKDIRFKVIPNDVETARIGTDTLYVKSFTAARRGKTYTLQEAKELISSLKNQQREIILKKDLRLTMNPFYLGFMLLIFLIELSYRKYKDLS